MSADSDKPGQDELLRALQESQARYKAIVDAFDGLIYVCSQDYRVEFMNQRFIERTGYDGVGQLCYKALHNLEAVCPWCVNDRVFRGEIVRWEVLSPKDNRWFYVVNTPIYHPDGSISKQAMILDITERKEAEQKLRDERMRLERQMLEAQKLESLGLLAGGIAHDFNNLLMGVLGNADLVLLSLTPGALVAPFVQHIKTTASRLAELTHQLLAYSGRGKFVLEPIELSGVVEEMGRILEVSLPKKVEMRRLLARGLPPLEGDDSQIRQVVLNLITNAAEAIGDQGGVVSIRTGLIEEAPCPSPPDTTASRRQVFLEVSDTGCGMDEETRARIFDPFFSTKSLGRGLGLAAVQGIVRGHQGTIEVKTAPGEGTTFRLVFPANGQCVGEQKGPPLSRQQTKRQGTTVLIVDDEETIHAVVRAMLQRGGYQSLSALDGQSAIQMLLDRRESIDLVLLDLTMPQKDGLETFRELRRIRPDLRIILSSGFDEQEVIRRFPQEKLDGFIQKPYEVQTLLAKIDATLAGAPAPATNGGKKEDMIGPGRVD